MSRRRSPICALSIAIGAVVIAASAADAATTVHTGKYKGKTSQNLAVKLTLKSKGTRVDFDVPYAKETDCSGNSTFVAGNTDIGRNVHVKKNGTFTFTFSGKQPVTINGQTGASDHYTYTVTGKFGGKNVTGTFNERDDIFDAQNNAYGSCSTKNVTYTAKLQPRRRH